MPVKRVMIVDPSLYSRMVLSNILKTNGYNVCYEAKDGDDAIENYEKAMPDFVLVEAQMPVKDGIATIKELCKRYKECSAFLCASAGQRSQVCSAMAVGALDFVAKPYTERGVLRTLIHAAVKQPSAAITEEENAA